MRYFIRLSFKGTRYNGWQIQRNGLGIQEEVNKALSLYLGENIAVCGAGRTDAGVHAINYIAHFDSIKLDLQEKHIQYAYKLNAILPPDICVHAITPLHEQAHARFDALQRTYRYYIHFHKNPFADAFSTFCPYPLDIDAMNRAALFLKGTHDFTSFSKLHVANKTAMCTVSNVMFTPLNLDFFVGIVFEISANRFLRNMVRAIVGTLINVGRGQLAPEEIPHILALKDRKRAGNSVSAQGLFLCQIDYPYVVL